MDQLKQQLKEMIVQDLNLPDVKPEDIDDKASLFEEGLGLDSLDAVELVVLLQKRFGVQIADMDEGKEAFASIEALAQFVQAHQESSESTGTSVSAT
ncbi:MAG: acyl carrier protein [Deltaproteobacteria bacterium]|nr:acyl carrier protein [Deltaproteobacteria bacterium]MBW1964921.1 acyl carrier protein [Deltaproteobacteria bacterium]MBW2080669.1 acyl carrier protein [Deltaproteobacteria bacterium]